MRDLKKEVFKALYLNGQNQIIDTADLFEGTVNSSAVPPREVIEGAIKNNAVSIVFAHNHPSGNPEPSTQDRELTRELVYAGKVMRINVLDHIIIGDNGKQTLTDEENEVLTLFLTGVSCEEIANKNGIDVDIVISLLEVVRTKLSLPE